jgi:N-acetylneuraminate synthase
MTMHEIVIDGRKIGGDRSPYVIAELSGNHNGKIERAFALMEMAKKCGADAVKLQTYTADTMTIDCAASDFQIKGGLWNGRSLYELYQEAQTPWEWHEPLFAKGRELGITVFSTPFDETAVELLEELGTPAYKIASFELVDLELIRCVAETRKPTVISTGMGSPEDIAEAVATFRDAGGRDLILLHCVSGYPSPVEQSNLRRIPLLAVKYGCPVGLSDHTLGTEVAIASASLGACVIEKHVTLARSDGGPDAAFSLEPQELTALVRGVDAAFAALGTGSETRAEVEKENVVFRRSIYAVRDIQENETFSRDNIRVIRPGFGIAPKHLPEVLGKKSLRKISRGTALKWDFVG